MQNSKRKNRKMFRLFTDSKHFSLWPADAAHFEGGIYPCWTPKHRRTSETQFVLSKVFKPQSLTRFSAQLHAIYFAITFYILDLSTSCVSFQLLSTRYKVFTSNEKSTWPGTYENGRSCRWYNKGKSWSIWKLTFGIIFKIYFAICSACRATRDLASFFYCLSFVSSISSSWTCSRCSASTNFQHLKHGVNVNVSFRCFPYHFLADEYQFYRITVANVRH